MTTQSCAVQGCGRPVAIKAAGLCFAHYQRRRRHGDCGPAQIETRVPQADHCSVAGCGDAPMARGLCPKHYSRWRQHGTTALPPASPAPRGDEHASWAGDNVTYAGAHSRLFRHRGSPREHTCTGCGDVGRHWVLMPGSTAALTDSASGLLFSPDPADYQARCTRCTRYAPGGMQLDDPEPRLPGL
jgi:hypothetical protein